MQILFMSTGLIFTSYTTDVYYLDWAHTIFHQYYCLRVNRVQSTILKNGGNQNFTEAFVTLIVTM